MTKAGVASLYRRYGPIIFWRCLKILRDQAAAEDATQETFLRVHRHLDKAPNEDEAIGWIWRIATNYCLNEVRNRKHRAEPVEALPEVPAMATVEQTLADRDLAARVVDRVDEKLRAVAWVHHVDGLDQVEVARVLGVSRRTVHNRLAAFSDQARKIIARLS